MVTEQLRWAADHGLQHRVELLLRHQVDPDGRGYHPNYGDQTPYRLAVLAGFPVIAQLLAEAGADTSVVDEVDSFLGACLAGDEQRAADWAAADPSLPRRARERLPTAVAKAAENGRTGPVRLLLGYGFDPGVPERFGRTALHEAAHGGHTDLVRLLLEVGADPSVTDDRFRATPADWARHSGQLDIAELLSDAERKLGSR
nr:ankyrin repeat domain-containing protein [Microlunatus panaciterrae]